VISFVNPLTLDMGHNMRLVNSTSVLQDFIFHISLSYHSYATDNLAVV
jgi:hypothetical protein